MPENQPKLGKLLQGGEERDAIHIAIAPITAGDYLSPGQHVGIGENNVAVPWGTKIGIVDPFLKGSINKGQKFYLFLYPNTITSLRHEWKHPDLPKEENVRIIGSTPDVQASIDWMNNLVQEINGTDYEYYGELTLDELLIGADAFLLNGSYLTKGGLLEGYYAGDEFWSHYERIRGKVVPSGSRENFFSCSC